MSSTSSTITTTRFGTERRTRVTVGWRLSIAMLVVFLVAAAGAATVALKRAAPAAAAPRAPAFTLRYISGGHGSLSVSALRGHPVLLDFTNSQCGACLDELPSLKWAWRTFNRDGVEIVSVATQSDTAAAAGRLAAAVHLPFPVLLDDQAISWQYDVQTVPTAIFIDAQGVVRGQQVGGLDQQTIRDGLAQIGAIQCSPCRPVEALGALGISPSDKSLNADFVFSPPRRSPYYALKDQNGRTITPASLRGKVVALTFLSSVCREQCPLLGITMKLVRRQLGAAARSVSVVVISVDPEVDSAANTRAFAQEAGWAGTDWHYLTAPRRVLAPIWAAYGIYVPAPAPIYKPGVVIVHQAGIYLVDSRGDERAYFNVPVMATQVAAAARSIM